MLPRSLLDLLDKDLDLNGRWLGHYGPHGDEVVELTQKGEELAAKKITGDPNVPAGAITFRAKLTGWGGRGEGQIAETGFKNARFVPGFFSILGRDRAAFEWVGYGRVVFKRLR